MAYVTGSVGARRHHGVRTYDDCEGATLSDSLTSLPGDRSSNEMTTDPTGNPTATVGGVAGLPTYIPLFLCAFSAYATGSMPTERSRCFPRTGSETG